MTDIIIDIIILLLKIEMYTLGTAAILVIFGFLIFVIKGGLKNG